MHHVSKCTRAHTIIIMCTLAHNNNNYQVHSSVVQIMCIQAGVWTYEANSKVLSSEAATRGCQERPSIVPQIPECWITGLRVWHLLPFCHWHALLAWLPAATFFLPTPVRSTVTAANWPNINDEEPYQYCPWQSWRIKIEIIMGCCCAPMKGSNNETRLEGKVIVITGKILIVLSSIPNNALSL